MRWRVLGTRGDVFRNKFFELLAGDATFAAVAPVVLYRAIGPKLPKGREEGAALWAIAQIAAQKVAESIRRAGIGTDETKNLGDELFDKIIEAGYFTEVQIAITMQQMVRAMSYMHESGVCHRDLKPEDFLFQTKEAVEKSTLEVIVMGLSCAFTHGQVLTTKAGTPPTTSRRRSAVEREGLKSDGDDSARRRGARGPEVGRRRSCSPPWRSRP